VIVDAHAHVWSAGPYAPVDGVPLPAVARPASELLDLMDGAGVDAAVLVQPRVHGADHAYLSSVLAAEPRRFAGICLADPRVDGAAASVRALVEASPGYRGIRLVGPSDDAAIWQLAADLDLVVGLLVEPWHLDDVAALAASHPDVRIVVDHLGRCRAEPQVPPSSMARLVALARLPNVWVKVSGLYALSAAGPPYADLATLVRACWWAFGPSRLLWGTDYPHVLGVGPYPAPAETLTRLLGPLPAADLAQVTGATAAELYDVRP
jgi:L-fuconolactonase